ncbi:SlyX family protein [Zobellella taiwanensis]|jgi:SlyX protein|uniref:Protein SlyX homolog n=1 Tax=Zobellella taiwanensis TaxID=347535 RepID=A0A2P7QL85_9GAMM|nr:SlyX family protein [Zobellella taiwanensis]PSJ38726.1 lysis protein [Zobellella taiwanensis]
MNDALLQRLEQLETRLAFQDDTIEQLNQEITAQGGEIARLKLQLGLLSQKFKELQPGQLASQAEETPPPHY